MSVTKDKRTPTEKRFETGEAFKGLAVYTIQVCKNEKNFPKRDRWVLTQEIVKSATKAYGHVMEANSIEVKIMKDYKLRREYQVKAKAKLKKLEAYIEIAAMALSLDKDRIDYWEEYIESCRELLSKWRESDRKRYKKQLEEAKRKKKEAAKESKAADSKGTASEQPNQIPDQPGTNQASA